MPDKIKFGDVGSDYEPSPSEDEYSEGEKELLKNVRQRRRNNYDSDDEMQRQAVLGFDDEGDYDEDDDEEEPDFDEIRKFEHDSDIDDKDDEDDLPDRYAWGSKSGAYYGTGYKDRDYDTLTAQEEELARLEEEEAMEMQKRLIKGMTDEDFALDDFWSEDEEQAADELERAAGMPEKMKQKDKKAAFSSKEEIVIKGDLSDLTDSQRLELFRKESPEFQGLVKECSAKLAECANVLEPVLLLLKQHNQLSHPLGKLLAKRYELHMLYCSNISFYVLLKSQRVDIRNHPLVKRLLQMKRLVQEIEQKYEQTAKAQVEALLKAQAEGMQISFHDEFDREQRKTKKGLRLRVLDELEQMDSQSEDEQNGKDEQEESEEYATKRMKMDTGINHSEEEEDEEDEQQEEQVDMDEMDGDEKRKITYQMAKNKGLSARKRKDQRNIRVKNKLKFRKAMIRRKGAIRTVRTETKRYTGESNIKPFVKRGIKLK
ncbi:something about silencing protein 10 [Anopheles maculipalpis]|uniref:something about silencing protein 10 n=1 Tax=Anopheles maculipalpis TaxID=1496333 RepID=UPI002159B0B9|nr:something about silencing protein 10 [Anopheles maculipalpis]